jgi:outer membrane protein TolC
MKRIILIGAMLQLMFAAHAQTVDSLIREALSNNPQIRSYGHQIDAAGSRASSVGAWPAPTLGFEASQVPSSSANVTKDAISNNISISQMFMLGGKLSAMSEVERRRGTILEQGLASVRVQLRNRVRMNYAQLWLLDRQINVQERTVNLFLELAQAMQPHVITNRMRQADLYSVQAEVASERARLRDLRTKRFSLQSAINAILGREDLTRAVNSDSVMNTPPLVLDTRQLIEEAKAANPALSTMDRMKDMNEAEIDAAQKTLIPDLMIQGMIMRMPNGMLLTSGTRSVADIQQSAAGMAMTKTDWMYSIMASITLPFVPWSSERATSKAAEMRSNNLSIDAEKEAMQREMIATLRGAISRYQTADSLIREYESEILPLMRQAAEAQTGAYLTGQVPITTVLDARRMELMKRDDYLMVVADREMAYAEIEMMVGTSLH